MSAFVRGAKLWHCLHVNHELFLKLNVDPRYSDNEYEYRHVQLPKNMLKAIPKEYFDPSKGTLKLLWEEEWRGLGITQASKTAACIVNGRGFR